MSIIKLIQEKGIRYVGNAIVSKLRKKLFVCWMRYFYKGDDKNTYSQYAEDLFIDKVFNYKNEGTYIDVGANDPEVINNTKKFYDRGWRGVNVEPNVDKFEIFQKKRVLDLNINAGVGKSSVPLVFYSFNPDTLSTFSGEVAEKLVADGYALLSKNEVSIISLDDVFKKMGRTRVDFISIDTEGYDEEVLRSNDWRKNRANLVCIEDDAGDRHDSFFESLGYKKIANNGLNSFFYDQEVAKR